MAMTDEELIEVVGKATTAQLVGLLYDRVVSDLERAYEGEWETETLHLVVHAQQIVAELNRSLNLREGGELAKNLSEVYGYCSSRLTEAMKNRDKEPIEEVEGLLSQLRGVWKSLSKKEDSNG